MQLFPLSNDDKETAENELQIALSKSSIKEIKKNINALLEKYPDYIDAQIQKIYLDQVNIENSLLKLYSNYCSCLKESNLYEDNIGLFSTVEETKRLIDISYYYVDSLITNKHFDKAKEFIFQLLDLDYPDNYNLRYTLWLLLLKDKQFQKYLDSRRFYENEISLPYLLINLIYLLSLDNKLNNEISDICKSIKMYHPIFIDIISGKMKLTNEQIENSSLQITYNFNSIDEAIVTIELIQKFYPKFFNKLCVIILNNDK